MSTLFRGLKKGLEEALAHSKGKIILKSEIIKIPKPQSKDPTGQRSQKG